MVSEETVRVVRDVLGEWHAATVDVIHMWDKDVYRPEDYVPPDLGLGKPLGEDFYQPGVYASKSMARLREAMIQVGVHADEIRDVTALPSGDETLRKES